MLVNSDLTFNLSPNSDVAPRAQGETAPHGGAEVITSCSRLGTIERNSIGPNDPVRLHVAARIAFKDGSMTVSGLRREVCRGRLSVEKIAGRYYTTLADIERMRVLCREEQKGRAYTSVNAPDGPGFGLSSTEKMKSGLAAAQKIAEALKKHSKLISPKNTDPIGGTVIQPK